MTDPVNDGGPAFPCEDHYNPRGKFHQTGMTLRDWFAGQALAGIYASQWFKDHATAHLAEKPASATKTQEGVAITAYAAADAMLAARAARL